MGLDDAESCTESDSGGKCCEHYVKNAYGSDRIRQRVRIHEIWDDSWGRRQPTKHGRLDKGRCQAHEFVVKGKLLNISK